MESCEVCQVLVTCATPPQWGRFQGWSRGRGHTDRRLVEAQSKELGSKPMERQSGQGCDARHASIDSVLWAVRRRGVLSHEEDVGGVHGVDVVSESVYHARADRAHGCRLGESRGLRGTEPSAASWRASEVIHEVPCGTPGIVSEAFRTGSRHSGVYAKCP